MIRVLFSLLFLAATTAMAQSSETPQRQRSERGSRGERSADGERGPREGAHRGRPAGPPVLDGEFIRTKLPANVTYHSDLVFKRVGDTELKLDLLLPDANTNTARPVAVWIHGGAWMRGNKARDFQRYDKVAAKILSNNFALASISYRLSGEAQFPEPVKDCRDAFEFLHKQRKQYGLDTEKMIVMGSSAGGHLASLMGTGGVDHITQTTPEWTIRGVVNFYGPSDLLMLQGKRDSADYENDSSPEARFLGHSPLLRPDLAKAASPTTYVSEASPPFLIFHGDEDMRVPITQSVVLNAWLQTHGVQSQLTVVPGAKHGDEKFDNQEYVDQVSAFIQAAVK